MSTQHSPLKKIQVKNLHKAFAQKVVLDDLILDVSERESLVIIGASGTGKSVFIKTILGLIPEDRGDIFIDGVKVSGLSFRARQSYMKKFGVLFQGGALFDSLPIWQNVAFSLLQGTNREGIRYNKKEAKEIATQKLKTVQLTADVADHYPSELSGGMQKRVALARAIAGEPEILFFDEPTTGLDPITSSTINHLIRELVGELGITAVTITHDMSSVRSIADRVAFLHEGKIMWQGPVSKLDHSGNSNVHKFIHGLPDAPMGDR